MKDEIKKNLLKMLSKDMSSMMSEKRELPKKGMAVKVIAKDEEGLKSGLSKAEELLKLRSKESGEEESEDMMPHKLMSKMSESEDEEDESCEMPESEESEDSIEDLKAQLEEIQAKIAAKKA
jgi:hypothetical protein